MKSSEITRCGRWENEKPKVGEQLTSTATSELLVPIGADIMVPDASSHDKSIPCCCPTSKVFQRGLHPREDNALNATRRETRPDKNKPSFETGFHISSKAELAALRGPSGNFTKDFKRM